MKLTPEQIQTVEKYLTNKDVEYIDLHLEVLDHISSDIETKMTEEAFSFSDAFEEVKLEWNTTFSYKWSYWLGISNGGSKLFIDHCLRIYKPLLLKNILGIVLCIGLFYGSTTFLKIELNNYASILKSIYLGFGILFPAGLIYWKNRIKKMNVKSTYSYLFNKQIFPNIFMVLLFLLQSQTKEGFDNLVYVYFIFIVFTMLMGFYFYQNHLKVVSNYKKYQLQ